MSDLKLVGDFLVTIFLPGFVAVVIVGVLLNTRKKNIAYNCIGFLLLLLSVAIGAGTTFADASIPNNFALSDWYKLIGFVSGMLGTAICAIVAFSDQAKS